LVFKSFILAKEVWISGFGLASVQGQNKATNTSFISGSLPLSCEELISMSVCVCVV